MRKLLVIVAIFLVPFMVAAASYADNQYQKLAEAYDSEEEKEFYEFILALEALEKSLTGEDKTVILDANSELAQILAGVSN